MPRLACIVVACAGILAAFPAGWRHSRAYIWTRSFKLLISNVGFFVQPWFRLPQSRVGLSAVTPCSVARCAGNVQLPSGIWQRLSLAAVSSNYMKRCRSMRPPR